MTTQTTTQETLVVIQSHDFQRGYEYGRSWYFHGDTPEKPVTETDVIDFIVGNMIELALEGYLPPERLADNAGFLIGWISGKFFPEEKRP